MQIKQNAKKPKYNALQISLWLSGRARRETPVVLPIVGLLILLGVGINAVELFAVPVILGQVEANVALPVLLRTIGLFTAATILVYAGRQYLHLNALFGRVHLRVNISADLHQKFCRTSFPNILDTSFLERSENAQKPTFGNQGAAEAIWKTLIELAIHSLSFVLFLCVLTSVNWLILGIVLASAVISYYAGKHLRRWSYRHREEKAALEHRLSYVGKTARDRKMAKDLRLFGFSAWLTELWDKNLRLLGDFHRRSTRHELLADLADISVTLLKNGLAYWYLIHLALGGGLTASAFVLLFSAVTGLGTWTSAILKDVEDLNRQSAELSVTREFLEEPEVFRFEDGKPLPVIPGHLYRLELRDVSYRYPGSDTDVLSHIDLTVQPGEKLAVVGLNGAGKTTLIRLLCGFLDPTEGSVLLDGEDIRQYNRGDYYKLISAVFQQSSLLAGTVEENVAQTEQGIDSERVLQCLAWAGLSESIDALPEKEKTLLDRKVFEQATELSGGQLQRLYLARALYKNASILVLDEPTAALDAITESAIYQKYNEMTKDCTSIYISHRLASTRFCDRIIFVANGKITEEGTHETLLAKGGAYADLFEVQSKYYREEAAKSET